MVAVSRLFWIGFAILVGTSPSALAAPAANQAEFDRTVKPFFAAHCNKCHGEIKPKGDLRLDNISLDFAMPSNATHWTDILDRINSGAMPPMDQKRPDAKDMGRVVEWIATQFAESEAARLARRERVTYNKLTREEYANTVRDLLGVTYDPRDPIGLSEDEAWHGFERIGSVLSLSPSHVEKYFAAAELILSEALPEQGPERIHRRLDAYKTKIGLADKVTLEEKGVANKIRYEMWPGHFMPRTGPGRLNTAGNYRVRIQLSGLKPSNKVAPHLAIYCVELDRMLFEQDVVAPENKPITLEFQTHLPAGNYSFRISNQVPGPSNLPRSGRDTRAVFTTIKDPNSRSPWQMKLTDEEGLPLYPFLIVDWAEIEGPIVSEGPTYARQQYIPNESSPALIRESLARFADRAFRRPATKTEIDRLVKLVEKQVAGGESLESAMKTALLAVMCSKDFLYIVEGNAEQTTTKLNDWELASRLSYFLWSSMPDVALLDAARAGKLHEPQVLQAHVKRMLADPRAARFAESFPRQWLQLRMVGMFPPDKKLYPNYDAYLEKSMIGETTSYFREVLEKNLSLREFLDSDWTMLNARLADHYGIPNVTEDRFQRVSLKAADHRGGLLTHASVLSLTSDGQRHRPVHRGKWVLESIVGKSPPPPPPNIDPIEPTPAMQPKATFRMKLDAHKTNVNCASCHRSIDPLGLAFDNYDAIGRWRTHEIVSDGVGDNPKVDPSGELPDGRKFADAAEFKKHLLADIDQFNAAFVEKLAIYALRRTMTIDDRPHLAAIAKKSKADDYKLGNIVEALVLSDLFQRR